MNTLFPSFGKTAGIIRHQLVRRILWTSLNLFVSVFLVWWLLKYVDLGRFVVMAERVPLRIILAAFGVYLFLNFCRALRFRLLLDQKQLPLRVFFPVILYYNFLTRTLPFMAGEISYVALLRRYLGQRASEGVSSLMTARLFDLLLVIVGGLAGVLSVGMIALDISVSIVALLLALFIGLAVIIYFAGFVSRCLVRWWQRLVKAGPWRRLRLLNLIGEKLGEIPCQLDRIRRPALFWKALVLSVLIYGSSLGFNMLLLFGVGIRDNFGILLLVVTGVMVASCFPFSFSGFGVIEGGWTVGLTAFAGLHIDQAVSAGFFIHGAQIVMYILAGIIGLILLLRIPHFDSVSRRGIARQ